MNIPVILSHDFNIDNFDVPNKDKDKDKDDCTLIKNNTFYIFFPQYKYHISKNKSFHRTLCIKTNPIELRRFGIPDISVYRPSDDFCCYIKFNLDITNEDIKSVYNVFEKIDMKFTGMCDDKKFRINGDKREKLYYVPIIRGNDYSKKLNQLEYTKFHISLLEEEITKINFRFVVYDQNGNYNDNIITSISELRKIFPKFYKAQFYLEFKLLLMRKYAKACVGKKKIRECILKIFCNRIDVMAPNASINSYLKEKYLYKNNIISAEKFDIQKFNVDITAENLKQKQKQNYFYYNLLLKYNKGEKLTIVTDIIDLKIPQFCSKYGYYIWVSLEEQKGNVENGTKSLYNILYNIDEKFKDLEKDKDFIMKYCGNKKIKKLSYIPIIKKSQESNNLPQNLIDCKRCKVVIPNYKNGYKVILIIHDNDKKEEIKQIYSLEELKNYVKINSKIRFYLKKPRFWLSTNEHFIYGFMSRICGFTLLCDKMEIFNDNCSKEYIENIIKDNNEEHDNVQEKNINSDTIICI